MGSVARLEPDDPREIGPYRLLGQLGGGGMGRVFLGMSPGGRPIAVKIIRPELAADPEFLTRFRREVEAARKVSGLFTALVVDADLDGSLPWLATAYVPGPSLAEAVDGHGPLPTPTLLALTAGLAESLAAIHAAGVVHRDLKPSNVLLAEDGPRVIDFGISQAAEASAKPGSGVVIGSPGYMSPEQVLDLDIGTASDMFSLGSVLVFAATGQPPFGHGPRAAVSYRLVNSQVSLRHVPLELRALIGNCLAKDPQDRPTARELLTQVGAIQPARGWIAEPILSAQAADRADAGSAGPVAAGTLLPFASLVGPAAAGPAGARRARGARRQVPRAVATAGVTGGLVAACAAVVFLVLGSGRQPVSHGPAQAGATVTAPGSPNPQASSSAGVTRHGTNSPAAPDVYAGPSTGPSLSEFLSPTPSVAASSPGDSASAAPSNSAAASPSASAPASPSASAPASPSASAPASPSASASASPSASASATPTSSATPTPTPTTPTPVPTPTEGTPSPAPSASGSASPSAPATGSASPSAVTTGSGTAQALGPAAS